MTTLTNGAILLAARDVEVTCGGCRMTASPARVLGIVERTVTEKHRASRHPWKRRIVIERSVEHAIVQFRCRTPECDVGGISCEVPL